jgi:hypothetical protein
MMRTDRPICSSPTRIHEAMSDEMSRRLDAARELSKAGRHDEATAEFVWLWENIDRVDPGMEGVRVSFMAKNIRELVDKHEAARVRFVAIRDRAASLADIDLTTARLRFDWIVLNEILSEPERTLAWFDGVKNDERYALVLDRCAHRLVDLLEERGRFGDIGQLYRDPVATLVKQHRARLPPPHITAEPDPDVPEKIQPHMRKIMQMLLDHLPKQVIEDAALMVKCLLAAGRPAEAVAVEHEARRIDPSEEMRAALERARGRLD